MSRVNCYTLWRDERRSNRTLIVFVEPSQSGITAKGNGSLPTLHAAVMDGRSELIRPRSSFEPSSGNLPSCDY
jgi:hypothetical protein